MKVMKKFKYIIYSLLGVLGLASCDLTGNINDIKPEYVLDESTLIRDGKSAELALRGVYQQWRDKGLTLILPNMCFLSGSITGGGIETTPFINNDVRPETNNIAAYYVSLYRIVNYANTVMEQLEAGKAVGLDSLRRVEMMGECKFHRAMANFFLLRAYGQFYDETSLYGIVLVKKHMQETKAVPRNSVADVYKLINEDLDDAIEMAPEYVQNHYSVSRVTAKTLKAKVLLYQKEYKKAADLASEILEEAGEFSYVMEINYADIYKNGCFSSEVLFAPYTFGLIERLTLNVNGISPGVYLRKVADDFVAGKGDMLTGEGFDSRYVATFIKTSGPNNNGKYPNNDYVDNTISNTCFYLRLGEVYLIHAEAAIRGYQDYAGARTSLKAITDRAGYDENYVNTISDGDLLETVRKHKLIELVEENYEDWFDLVRYYKEGDLNITDVKPTVTSDTKLILPIPQTALAGNNLLEQNPL